VQGKNVARHQAALRAARFRLKVKSFGRYLAVRQEIMTFLKRLPDELQPKLSELRFTNHVDQAKFLQSRLETLKRSLSMGGDNNSLSDVEGFLAILPGVIRRM
jgi:hypothetical protein